MALDTLRKGFGGFKGEANWMIAMTVFNGISASFMWFLFTLYLEELNYAPSAIGIALMTLGLALTVPLLPAGYLGDKFGRKRMIVLPSFLALMSEKVSDKRRKYLFSLQAFAGMIAGALAVLVAGFFPAILAGLTGTSLANGFRLTFWIGLAFTLSQLLFVAPLTEEDKYGTKRKMTEDGKYVEESEECPPIPWKTLMLLCLPMALLGIGAGFIVPFFQLYFQWRFDTPVHIIGMLFSLTQFLWGVAYLIMPYFADKVGSVKAITLVQWVAIAALVGIPISPSFHFVALMFLIRMVIMNSTWPILQSYSLSMVPKEHRSFTLSATNFSFNLPKGITPGIAGYIFAVNLELPFFICAAFYITATIIFFTVFGKQDDKKERRYEGTEDEEE